jgi:pre-mRNA-splicing factor SYF2
MLQVHLCLLISTSSFTLMDSITDKTENPAQSAARTQGIVKDGLPDQMDPAEGSDETAETEGNDESESSEGKKLSMKDREAKLAQLRKRFVSSFHSCFLQLQNESIRFLYSHSMTHQKRTDNP